MRPRFPTKWAALCGMTVLCASALPAVALPVLLVDPFNDGSPNSNTGPGAAGPSQPWNSFTSGFTGAQTQIAEAGGLLTATATAGTTPYALAGVNSRSSSVDYGFYNPTGTTYSYTLGNMNVAHANPSARPDIPGADYDANNHAALRYELGVISYKDPTSGTNTSNDELYRTTAGGVFVYVFKDAAGHVTGSLRETNETHPQDSDSEGVTGVKTLASFDLSGDGVASFTVNLALTSGGYALSFGNTTATLRTGSLTGGFGTREDGTTPWFSASNWDTGALLNVGGQNWGSGLGGDFSPGSGGYGSLSVDQVRVYTTPEPAAMLTGVALAAGLLRRRRA